MITIATVPPAPAVVLQGRMFWKALELIALVASWVARRARSGEA